ncbi:hypothetical protein [Pseudoroseicyclus sp. CXY001]|uniref:hypothetical protein n=1 Tax=Pseudoroseicyclus sp. CXY001 TaxID=3242492 RepID=UPI00357096F9
MRSLLAALLLLAACGRPLTTDETRFARAFLGPDFDTESVRLRGDLAEERPRSIAVRPRTTCQERIYPESQTATIEVVTGALTAFQTVYFRPGRYLDDYLEGLGGEVVSLPAAMLFAHEMVHVWQWQNRATTGYHPLKAAFEHVQSADPYLFDPETEADFLDYGWEQQGSIFEEYVCCRTLAPEAARTSRLHETLGKYFDLPPLDANLAQNVLIPVGGDALEGICD